jgi:hypothetical protein
MLVEMRFRATYVDSYVFIYFKIPIISIIYMDDITTAETRKNIQNKKKIFLLTLI